MKKLHILSILSILATILLTSCGHNLGMVGIGTGWRAGNGEYGLAYGDGLFGTFVTKDGVQFKAELDSTTGFSYDPSTNTYKGVKSVEYSLPPQITGYAVDFAKDNPEVAKAYYKALLKFYETKKDADTSRKPLVSDEKSKAATSGVADVLRKALEKAKGLVGGSSDEYAAEPFECSGDCELAGLDKISSRSYQASVAKKLLTYADDTTPIHDSDATVKATLDQFLSRMQQYADKGISSVGLRVRRATIKSGILQDVTYVFIDGSSETETNCPECIFIKELDYKGEE
jgi:hypothetical protein